VSGAQRELWVEAAFEERVTLSEFVRRATDARAGGLEAGAGATLRVPVVETRSVVSPAAPASSPDRVFRPDPKSKK
jgi:hypothetical protein